MIPKAQNLGDLTMMLGESEDGLGDEPSEGGLT